MTFKTSTDPTVPALKCRASILTKGRVPCDRDVYAHGLCKAHYAQSAEAIRKHSGEYSTILGEKKRLVFIAGHLKPIGRQTGDLVQLPGPIRVPIMVADTLHDAAKEKEISTYELERFIIEEWVAKKKLEKKEAKDA